MTAPTDRIQLLKQESTALGGQDAQSEDFPVSINPQQDAPEVMGVFFQDASNRDEAVYITRSGSHMVLRDASVGTEKTLSEVMSGASGVLDVDGGIVYTDDGEPVTAI